MDGEVATALRGSGAMDSDPKSAQDMPHPVSEPDGISINLY